MSLYQSLLLYFIALSIANSHHFVKINRFFPVFSLMGSLIFFALSLLSWLGKQREKKSFTIVIANRGTIKFLVLLIIYARFIPTQGLNKLYFNQGYIIDPMII